jgi:energy-coupling factor transporter ATP-binding protein EcfA2
MNTPMDNPFKLLESYTKEDRDIWGGRTTEIDHLYNLSFASNLILVYGMSGVGKTSLIQCGLANKFKRTDWHAIWVLRRQNMHESLISTLAEEAETGPAEQPVSIPETIRKIYLKHFKPIFLVFDQLEELFIFGSNDEIQAFISTIKDILNYDSQCKIILVLREEYHGHLKTLQDAGLPVFKASVKIEPMGVEAATDSISKLLDKHKIITPDADHLTCATRIASDCAVDGRVDLANLQVYLFWAWEKAAAKAEPDADIAFTHSILREIGDGKNVLSRYLNAVVERVSNGKTGGVWYLLQHFVSGSQTKQPLRLQEVQDIDPHIARSWLNDLSRSKLVKCSRENGNESYSLAHDSLVPLILQKRTAASRGRNRQPSVHGNPFKGLPSYEENDAPIFFGRSVILRELLEFFEDKRLLVIVGPSGSGKSSIIKAGIIPALRAEGYQVMQGEPGTHPMVFGREIIKRMQTLDGGKFLLYIDQFEELSTQASPQESEEFIKMLNSLADSPNPATSHLKIVLSVRADYEYEFERSLANWRESKKTVPDLMESSVREIITEPAYLAGLEYKPAYLVDNIVRDVMQSNGTLPLLSYALEQMYIEYKKSGADDGYLTEDHYNAIGGVVDGLRLRATKLYTSSDPETQHTIKNVMLRMLSLSINEKASKRILAEDLVYESPVENDRVQKVLNELVNSRLIVSGPDESGNIYYEPAHDSLIRSWNLIGDWIRQYGKDLLYLQQDLSDAVKQFKINPKKLWHDDPKLNTLVNIMKSSDNWLNQQETNFVKKSLQRRNELEDRKHRREQELVEEKLSRQAAIAKLNSEKEKKEKELLREKLSKQEAIAKLNSEKEAALVEKLHAAKAKTRLQKQRSWLLGLGLLFLMGAAVYMYFQWNESNELASDLAALRKRDRQSADTLRKLNDSLNVTAGLASKRATEALTAKHKADSAAQQEKKARTVVEQQRKELLAKQTALLRSQEEIKKYSQSLKASAEALEIYSDSLQTQLAIIRRKTQEVEYTKLTAPLITTSHALLRSEPAMAYQLALHSLKYDSSNQRIRDYIYDTLNTRNHFYESFIIDTVSSAIFSDNGKTVLAVKGDNKLSVLDLAAHKEIRVDVKNKILSAQVSPVDNSVLVATENRLFTYNSAGVLQSTSSPYGNILRALYTTRGRVIVVTPNEVQIKKAISGPNVIRIPAMANTDDMEVSSNDTLLYIRKNDVIEAYDLIDGRSVTQYREPNSFLAKGGRGFIAVKGNYIFIGRSAGNRVMLEKHSVQLDKGYSKISIISMADNLRTFLFIADPPEKQQQQQRQQQMTKNFIEPTKMQSPLLYIFTVNQSTKRAANDLPDSRRLVLSENGEYMLTGENGSLVIYDRDGNRKLRFGGYFNYSSWTFNPVDTDMILSMNGSRLRLWIKGTPNQLLAQNKLKTFTIAEMEQAVKDVANRPGAGTAR